MRRGVSRSAPQGGADLLVIWRDRWWRKMAVAVGGALGLVEPVGGGEPQPAVYLWAVWRRDLPRLLQIAAQMAPEYRAPGVRDGGHVQVQVSRVAGVPGAWRVLARRSERTEVRKRRSGEETAVVQWSEQTHEITVAGVGPDQMRLWAGEVLRGGLVLLVLAEPAVDGVSQSVAGYDTWVPPENVTFAW